LIPAGSLSLVGLGDSVPGALRCEAPCRSYVDAYGELASAALHQPVVVDNLATNDGLTSRTLLHRIQGDASHRAAIASADLITLTIGNNDWQGPCDWSNHTFCLASGQKDVETNLIAILDEISELRGDKPTAIRVTNYYDFYAGDPNAASIWGLPSSAENSAKVHAAFSKALTAFDSMICTVATAHGATCVDIRAPFNGPKGTKDAGPLLAGDHIHPAKAGHDLIAKSIAAAGFAPLN
jgi:lysophospholipase L1-like esterase